MFRRWIRALARTGVPGRPFPVSPKVGRHPRTLLRLEAVEDRTLASISAVEPPKFPPAAGAHVGTTSKPATPSSSDDQTPASSDGSDHSTPQQPDAPVVAAAPVLMADGFTLTAADLPAPVARQQATL